jgi:hypothetical protein
MSSLTGDPESYDGEFVRLDASYYGAFEVSVLTSGFRASDPPQPIEPLVWVGVPPGDECLQISDRASFAERVEASGTFRYDPEGGFGHLGEYEMAIENAELVCVRAVS